MVEETLPGPESHKFVALLQLLLHLNRCRRRCAAFSFAGSVKLSDSYFRCCGPSQTDVLSLLTGSTASPRFSNSERTVGKRPEHLNTSFLGGLRLDLVLVAVRPRTGDRSLGSLGGTRGFRDSVAAAQLGEVGPLCLASWGQAASIRKARRIQRWELAQTKWLRGRPGMHSSQHFRTRGNVHRSITMP